MYTLLRPYSSTVNQHHVWPHNGQVYLHCGALKGQGFGYRRAMLKGGGGPSHGHTGGTQKLKSDVILR